MTTEVLQQQPEASPSLADRIKQILEIPKIALAPLVGYIRLFWKKLNTPPYNWEIKIPTQDNHVLIIQKQVQNPGKETDTTLTSNYTIKLQTSRTQPPHLDDLLRITKQQNSITDFNCECEQLFKYLSNPQIIETTSTFLLKLYDLLTHTDLNQLNPEQIKKINQLKRQIHDYVISQMQPNQNSE